MGASFIHSLQIRWPRNYDLLVVVRMRTNDVMRAGGHILQVCPRMWGHRIMRHDTLMNKFLQQLEIRGCTVCCAPTIPVRGGTPRKLYGVIYNDTQCWVIDATIVTDNADLNDAFISKCTKYDTPAVRDWCRSSRPSQGVSDGGLFGVLVFNWRGAMAS